MPLQIKNLSINVNVNQSSPDGGGENSSNPDRNAAGQPNTEKILRSAVEQIMEMLESKKER